MNLLVVLIILIVLFGGGGSYWGYRQYGGRGWWHWHRGHDRDYCDRYVLAGRPHRLV